MTGEASGDLHGANLASAIYNLSHDAKIVGVGGQKMMEAGVKLVSGVERFDNIGVPGIKQLHKNYQAYSKLKKILQHEHFDVVVFIDCPGMNLRLAKTAVKANQRVVYYIAPQIWAWGARRLRVIKRVVHRMIVILPFEESIYQQAGVPCSFVGHPLLDTIAPSYNVQVLREQFELSKAEFVLGIVPGSREHEVRNFLPVMLGAARTILENFPETKLVMAQSPTIPTPVIQELVDESGLEVKIVPNRPNEVMAASDLLFIASGTATLQAAIIGIPMVIAYRTSWLTYIFAKLLVKIPYIGLVNVVAGKFVVREFIQHKMTSERLSEEALRLLKSPEAIQTMREAFQAVRTSLGSPGASKRAAEVVLKEAQEKLTT